MNTETNIVTSTGNPIPCQRVHRVPITLKKGNFMYDAHEGRATVLSQGELHQSPSMSIGFNDSFSTPAITFHAYYMYNFSDFQAGYTLNDVWSVVNVHDDVLRAAGMDLQLTNTRDVVQSMANRITRMGFWSLFSKEFSIEQIWDFILKLYVTSLIAREIIIRMMRVRQGNQAGNNQISINLNERPEREDEDNRPQRSSSPIITEVTENAIELRAPSNQRQVAVPDRRSHLIYGHLSDDEDEHQPRLIFDGGVEKELESYNLRYVKTTLVDTGAEGSCLSIIHLMEMIAQMCNVLPEQARQIAMSWIDTTDTTPLSSAGEEIPVLGTTVLKAYLTSATSEETICFGMVKFNVIDYPMECIVIGYDCIGSEEFANKYMLDLTHGTIVEIDDPNNVTRSSTPTDEQEQCMMIRAEQKQKIMPIIPLMINDKATFPSLIDSGSSRSLIPGPLEGLSKKPIRRDVCHNLTSASGHPVPIAGEVDFDITIGTGPNSIKTTHTFLIMKDPYDYCILGTDLMAKIDGPLRFHVKEGAVSFGKLYVPFIKRAQQECTAHIAEKITLAPETLNLVSFRPAAPMQADFCSRQTSTEKNG